MYSSRQAGNNTYCLLSSPLMYFISDKCLISTKLRKYLEKTKDKVLTIRNIRRHFGCYGFSDNIPQVLFRSPSGLLQVRFRSPSGPLQALLRSSSAPSSGPPQVLLRSSLGPLSGSLAPVPGDSIAWYRRSVPRGSPPPRAPRKIITKPPL